MNKSQSNSNLNSSVDFCESGLQAFQIESEMLTYLGQTISSPEYNQACQLILNCQGKVICMGVGKSGHIARKISASFASTGTNSIFIHPCEAGHGDIGIITKDDVILYISNSGESYEFNVITSFIEANQIPIISITNNIHSTLAQKSTVVLELKVHKEACPLNLAPTATTTNSLVLGDCLVVSLLKAKQFTLDDFAKSHPSGALGKRLLTTNKQIMRVDEQLPLVTSELTVSECLLTMSNKNLGCVLITPKNDSKQCLGIFTDGDLRRIIFNKKDLYTTKISDVMSKKFIYGYDHDLAYNSLNVLKNKGITTMPIFNEQQQLCGIIHIHDLLRFGF